MPLQPTVRGSFLWGVIFLVSFGKAFTRIASRGHDLLDVDSFHPKHYGPRQVPKRQANPNKIQNDHQIPICVIRRRSINSDRVRLMNSMTGMATNTKMHMMRFSGCTHGPNSIASAQGNIAMSDGESTPASSKPTMTAVAKCHRKSNAIFECDTWSRSVIRRFRAANGLHSRRRWLRHQTAMSEF